MAEAKNDTRVWSGQPNDFDGFYEWAGKANVMETRGTDKAGKDHKLEVFDPVTGWVTVQNGQTVQKDALGNLTVKGSKAGVVADAVAKTEQAGQGSETQVPSNDPTPVPDPIGPGADKETKDVPAPGVETKPLLSADDVAKTPIHGTSQVGPTTPASDPATVAANSGTAATAKAGKAGK